jgi:hypothetical protein
MFGDSSNSPDTALQPFEPDASSVYPIETVATLVQMPRRHIVVYFKYGLVSPVIDPTCGGWWFDDEAIRGMLRVCRNPAIARNNLPSKRSNLKPPS